MSDVAKLKSALALLLAAAVCGSGPASAQQCGNDGGGFDHWVGQFRTQAGQNGISPATAASALSGLNYDTTVIRLDRGQKSFKLSFEDFYARRVSNAMIARGRQKMQANAQLLDRIEKRLELTDAPTL